MGVAISKYSEISSNEYLTRFCSIETISPNDPFWNQLLAYNITPPNTLEQQLLFDSCTEALLHIFLQNNQQTLNLGSLVQVFITKATELLASPSLNNVMLVWQTFNALFIIKSITKYLVEIVPEYELCKHLDIDKRLTTNGNIDSRDSLASTNDEKSQAQTTSDGAAPKPVSPKTAPAESRIEMLIDALIGLLIDVPVTDNTYFLHLECINTILVLMSVYTFSGVHGQAIQVESSLIFRTLFQGRCGMQAPLLVKSLLNNLSNMLLAPQHMFGTNSGGSLLLNIASGLWSMLTFSGTAKYNIFTHPPTDRHELLARLKTEHPLANQSCLLILALANHCMTSNNLYRRALLCCEDTSESSLPTPQKDKKEGEVDITPPRIEIASLHEAICATASCEHSTLLLYLMLHSCKTYKKYVSSAAHIEHLIIPILKVLYNAPESNSHHIYMALIILLMLTEDESLIRNVHSVIIKNPVWYTERCLSDVSLGGLMVLVILRALQYNMVRVRDKYLHTNCLAAIANMSCEFRNLHPYVAQRLISLFETLNKRRLRLCSEVEGGEGQNMELPHLTGEKTEEIMDHIAVLDEVLRMLVEILNSCLTHQLPSNVNLVYALLHKKHLFTPYNHHAVTQNIQMVIGYFSSRLQRVQEGTESDLGVTEVLNCIRKGAEQWSSDRLKKFPDLKFRYVEEDKPEEFFTPYVWGLISTCGGIYWSSEGGNKAMGDLVIC